MVFIEDKRDFSKKINNKLREYKRTDKSKRESNVIANEGLETINIKDAIKLVCDLDSDLCKGCNCKLLFCHYTPYCLYQFSFDRIDNSKVHCVDNLRIVCWNCNSSGYGSKKLNCSRKCHMNIE